MKFTCVFMPALAALCCLDSALAISKETLDEWTTRHDILDLDYESIFENRDSIPTFALKARQSFGGDITLDVRSNDRLFLGRRPEFLDEDFFDGTVRDQEGSYVTLTVWKAGLTGRISLPGCDNRRQTIHVDHLDETNQTVLYNENDMKRDANGGLSFADDEIFGGPGDLGGARTLLQVQTGPAKLAKRQNETPLRFRKSCRMVVAADSTFVEEFGERSVKQMVSIMQDVQQIYRREIGVSLPIQAAFLDEDDNLGFGNVGKSGQGVASDLLRTFSNAIRRDQIELDDVCLSHLFVSRRMGSALGVAFTASDDPNVVGGICSGSSAVGVSTQLGRDGRPIPLSVGNDCRA